MNTPVRVRRRILHWRPRWRGPRLDGQGPDAAIDGGPVGGGGGGGGFSFLDLLDDLFTAVLVAVAVAIFLATVVPAIVFAIELLLVAVVAVAGIVGRSLLGRPWTVEAIDTGSRRVVGSWQVVGFRRAGRVAAAIQAAADAGRPLPGPGDGTEALDPRADEPTWPAT